MSHDRFMVAALAILTAGAIGCLAVLMIAKTPQVVITSGFGMLILLFTMFGVLEVTKR